MPSCPSAINLSALDGTNGFVINGIDIGDGSGESVSNAGDVMAVIENVNASDLGRPTFLSF